MKHLKTLGHLNTHISIHNIFNTSSHANDTLEHMHIYSIEQTVTHKAFKQNKTRQEA